MSTGTQLSTTAEGLKRQFGKRLAELRRERGLTQQKLASALKMDTVSVAYMESGKRSPSFKTLHKLCRVLSVRPMDLFRF